MAMLDVAMILMSSRLSGYMRNGGTPSLMAIAIRNATNSAYPTKNGMVMLGASNLRFHLVGLDQRGAIVLKLKSTRE
jgi:crotonobetainyl-CoA:carnitine CoA-transferase CaiB-like acyl-CoA transferase